MALPHPQPALVVNCTYFVLVLCGCIPKGDADLASYCHLINSHIGFFVSFFWPIRVTDETTNVRKCSPVVSLRKNSKRLIEGILRCHTVADHFRPRVTFHLLLSLKQVLILASSRNKMLRCTRLSCISVAAVGIECTKISSSLGVVLFRMDARRCC